MTLIVSMLATSCTSELVTNFDEPQVADDIPETYKVSIDEAKETLNNFFASLADNAQSYSGDNNSQINWNRKIKNVEAIGVNNEVKTYASDNGIDVSIDTFMYAINFENDEGFALMASDKRTDPIIAIIDDGSFSMSDIDNIDNPGFFICMENAIVKQLNDIQEYSETKDVNPQTYVSGTITKQVYPRLSVKWNQDYPYNKYCPSVAGIKTGNGKGYTGCTIVAVAQILSYFRPLNHDMWIYNNFTPGFTILHWDKIIADSKVHNNKKTFGTLTDVYPEFEQSTNEVARLMRSLGQSLKADYKSSGTAAYLDDAAKLISKALLLSATSPCNYDGGKIVRAIEEGKLVMVTAYATKVTKFLSSNSYSDGHTWVIDGYIESKINGKLAPPFVHCNFGWGGTCDGYYVDGSFDTGVGSVDRSIDDNLNGSSKTRPEKLKFQYLREVSFVGKR